MEVKRAVVGELTRPTYTMLPFSAPMTTRTSTDDDESGPQMTQISQMNAKPALLMISSAPTAAFADHRSEPPSPFHLRHLRKNSASLRACARNHL